MTHVHKICSEILQIPHKSTLIKTERRGSYENNNQTKVIFQAHSKLNLDLFYVSPNKSGTWSKTHAEIQENKGKKELMVSSTASTDQ